MNFGLFMMPVHHPDKGLPRTLKEDMNTVVTPTEWVSTKPGSVSTSLFLGENLPAPDLFIAKAFALTENIKLGTGVVLLQLHDPKMLAHRISMLDHLGEGRFYSALEPEECQPSSSSSALMKKKRHARAAETLDAVLKIWESDGTWTIKGSSHQIKSPTPITEVGLGLWHKPLTLPHPPIAVAGVSRNSSTIEWAGENGWIPLTHRHSPSYLRPNPLGSL